MTSSPPPIVIIISAGSEWRAACEIFPDAIPGRSPYGELLAHHIEYPEGTVPLVLLHGGWGKIAAAAAAQYAIGRWSPQLLMNMGTCGGFDGAIELN